MNDYNEARVRQEIKARGVELDKFSGKNRYCVEWFDKYSAKYNELNRKFND